MLSLVIVEIPTERAFRWQYLTNWGVYITLISTFLNLLCALKYRKCITNFKLQIKPAGQGAIENSKGTQVSFFESEMKKDEVRVYQELEIEQAQSVP